MKKILLLGFILLAAMVFATPASARVWPIGGNGGHGTGGGISPSVSHNAGIGSTGRSMFAAPHINNNNQAVWRNAGSGNAGPSASIAPRFNRGQGIGPNTGVGSFGQGLPFIHGNSGNGFGIGHNKANGNMVHNSFNHGPGSNGLWRHGIGGRGFGDGRGNCGFGNGLGGCGFGNGLGGCGFGCGACSPGVTIIECGAPAFNYPEPCGGYGSYGYDDPYGGYDPSAYGSDPSAYGNIYGSAVPPVPGAVSCAAPLSGYGSAYPYDPLSSLYGNDPGSYAQYNGDPAAYEYGYASEYPSQLNGYPSTMYGANS
ncbi:MAG TPA: hypothetical protein VK436_13305 [Methanocella sp.]|nr:hypothetical protein [Methanocella sp.]